jgi:hypothetical protein
MYNNTNNNTNKLFTYIFCMFVFVLFCEIGNYLSGFIGAFLTKSKAKLANKLKEYAPSEKNTYGISDEQHKKAIEITTEENQRNQGLGRNV